MVDFEVTRETPDGRAMLCLTVRVGDEGQMESKMVAIDTEKVTTKQQAATALRTLAMLLDPPTLPT